VQAKVDTVDCALDPQNHPDPWPTDSQFFWFSANSANSAGMCELLHSQNVIVGPPSDNKAIQGTYYQISASEDEAAMYNHNITMAVAWDPAGCSVPSKPSSVDFSTYGVQTCHDAFDVPITICEFLFSSGLPHFFAAAGPPSPTEMLTSPTSLIR
jgi:hypothetical protein